MPALESALAVFLGARQIAAIESAPAVGCFHPNSGPMMSRHCQSSSAQNGLAGKLAGRMAQQALEEIRTRSAAGKSK
jgi:hypothetical protein